MSKTATTQGGGTIPAQPGPRDAASRSRTVARSPGRGPAGPAPGMTVAPSVEPVAAMPPPGVAVAAPVTSRGPGWAGIAAAG